MRLLPALLPAALLLVAACASSPAATPTPTPSPTAVPTASPSPVVTPVPSPVASPSPIGTPAPSMTPQEQALVDGLRPDVAVDCAPRRTDLPKDAIRGVECHPDDPLVESVGVYEFATENEAAYTYMTKLAEYGVDVRAGDCEKDVPGDAAWTPGDDVGDFTDPGVFNWENSVLSPNRNGCFTNEFGFANFRATCGVTYIGVLGTGKDLSDLYEWSRKYPPGAPMDTPTPPGICVPGN